MPWVVAVLALAVLGFKVGADEFDETVRNTGPNLIAIGALALAGLVILRASR